MLKLKKKLLKKEIDYTITYSLRLYPYLREKLTKTKRKLNSILKDNFSNEKILTNYLFAEHRGESDGFNNSLAIEFLIDIFDLLIQDKRDILDIILPEMERFIEEKKEIEIINEDEYKEESE